MFSFCVANTTVHFLPLLIILAIGVAIGILIVVWLHIQTHRMLFAYSKGKYEKSIRMASILLRFYIFSAKISISKKIHQRQLSVIEVFRVYIAASYLGMSQYDLFLEHINKVTKDLDMKNFWLAVFYLIENDIEQAKMSKEKISECERTKKSIVFLDGFLMYRENQIENAKKTLEEVYPDLKNSLVKNIASDIINDKM